MSEPAEHVLSRITIERYLTAEGRDLVSIESDDMNDGTVGIVEALGLLQLAIYDLSTRTADDGDDE